MVPDPSTTPAVTDHRRRALSGALVALVVLAGGWLVVDRSQTTDTPAAPPVAASVPPSLVVGDGRTVTLISLGGPATDVVLQRVAANIGPAVGRVEAFWGTDWTHDIVVVATFTGAQFSTQAAGVGVDIAAVAVADEVDPARRLVTGQRIVLAPGASGMSTGSLRVVLSHELFHYAARADTVPDAPTWLTEGVADYVARPAASVPARFRTPEALPADSEFTATGAQLSDAYDRSWLFCRFIAEQYGPQTLKQLYLRAAAPGRVDAVTAFRDVLHAGPDTLLTQWRAWLARAST